ncbi:MAG: hypothetical protein GY862_00670 [Gammaproteobacteria bacterium]|nr:hypothetical protein [Gammaproteobacteria bacterium]
MNSNRQIVQFDMDDGSPVYVEVEEVSGGPRLVSNSPGEAAQAQGKFTDALKYLEPAAKAVLDTFRNVNQPDEINLEFGVKFNGKLGAILASAGTEANFKVSLKWKNDKTQTENTS